MSRVIQRSTPLFPAISGTAGKPAVRWRRVGSGVLTLQDTYGIGIEDTAGLVLVSGSPIKLDFSASHIWRLHYRVEIVDRSELLTRDQLVTVKFQRLGSTKVKTKI
jgi:hypothetical protein